MTVQEKASQLVNQARAIRRLNVPAYDCGARPCTALSSFDSCLVLFLDFLLIVLF